MERLNHRFPMALAIRSRTRHPVKVQAASFALATSAELRNLTVQVAVTMVQVMVMDRTRTVSVTQSRIQLLALTQDASFARTRDSVELPKKSVLLVVVDLAMDSETTDAFHSKETRKHAQVPVASFAADLLHTVDLTKPSVLDKVEAILANLWKNQTVPLRMNVSGVPKAVPVPLLVVEPVLPLLDSHRAINAKATPLKPNVPMVILPIAVGVPTI